MEPQLLYNITATGNKEALIGTEVLVKIPGIIFCRDKRQDYIEKGLSTANEGKLVKERDFQQTFNGSKMCLYFDIKISCQKFANPSVGNTNLEITESIFFHYAGQQGQIPYSHFELPLKQDVTETSDILFFENGQISFKPMNGYIQNNCAGFGYARVNLLHSS